MRILLLLAELCSGCAADRAKPEVPRLIFSTWEASWDPAGKLIEWHPERLREIPCPDRFQRLSQILRASARYEGPAPRLELPPDFWLVVDRYRQECWREP
jgi:hypothetical protein